MKTKNSPFNKEIIEIAKDLKHKLSELREPCGREEEDFFYQSKKLIDFVLNTGGWDEMWKNWRTRNDS